jgi:glycosyltransferase involved in cell wall biosynthesis
MKILMIVRTNLYTSPGGDTTQIDMTAKYLRLLGVSVTIALADQVEHVGTYDLLHFFNIIRPDDILPFIEDAAIPFVISTIFVDYSSYEKQNRAGIAGLMFRVLTPGQVEYLKAVARWILNGDRLRSRFYIFKGHKASMRRLVRQAQMLLPNSNSEYKRLVDYLKMTAPYKKVVNAIDADMFNDDVEEDSKYKNHVLCVGRIEGRKNQLNLIKSLLNTEVQLTIIGKPSPNHLAYYQACKDVAAAANNIHFIEHMPHHQLVRVYKAAKVHVLPSWFETTGLSSLEAAVMGCNIVVTDKGDTTEYFGNMAYYCEPNDLISMKTAVLRALNEDVNADLQKFIRKNYTWNETAAQTLSAYQEILSMNKPA